jgi:3-methyladenine DNA glycosylase AlkC
MNNDKGITKYFGVNLAEILSDKIKAVYPNFDDKSYIEAVSRQFTKLGYTQRIMLHSQELSKCLPHNYEDAISILMKILGEENPNETGMFSEYYWIMPIGKYVELYGLNDFFVSMNAIGEITKRNTGEYAIRPFLEKYPDKTIKILINWAQSENFHLRRLASEGSRPKLPWSTKLDIFIDNPEPVFNILSLLKKDEVKFVQKSVANNITDYLKVNYEAARKLLREWSKSKNKNTQWIIKYSTRKIKI